MMLFRSLQVIVLCLIIPMMCLGMMAGLSGGGLNPTFQRIGQILLVLSPLIGLIGLVGSIILWRIGQPQLAYIAISVPIVMWFGLLIWLQVETGFFG